MARTIIIIKNEDFCEIASSVINWLKDNLQPDNYNFFISFNKEQPLSNHSYNSNNSLANISAGPGVTVTSGGNGYYPGAISIQTPPSYPITAVNAPSSSTITISGTNTISSLHLPPGSSGQVLTIANGGTGVSWQNQNGIITVFSVYTLEIDFKVQGDFNLFNLLFSEKCEIKQIQ